MNVEKKEKIDGFVCNIANIVPYRNKRAAKCLIWYEKIKTGTLLVPAIVYINFQQVSIIQSLKTKTTHHTALFDHNPPPIQPNQTPLIPSPS